MLYGNHGLTSYRFLEKGRFQLKTTYFSYLPEYLTKGLSLEFCNPSLAKKRVMASPDGEKVCRFAQLFQHNTAFDRQKDRSSLSVLCIKLMRDKMHFVAARCRFVSF